MTLSLFPISCGRRSEILLTPHKVEIKFKKGIPTNVHAQIDVSLFWQSGSCVDPSIAEPDP